MKEKQNRRQHNQLHPYLQLLTITFYFLQILKRNRWRADKARDEQKVHEKHNPTMCENVLKTRMVRPTIIL